MSKIFFAQKDVEYAEIKEPEYVKQYPYVDDKGIWMPIDEYVREDRMALYRMVISKELFVEAYNMWIKGDVENEKD